MPEVINDIPFTETVLRPAWNSALYPQGFGLGLSSENPLDFDSWLDKSRHAVIALVKTWGVVSIASGRIAEERPWRWGRLREEHDKLSLPWHADGFNGFKVVMLAQSQNDTARDTPTLVAPTEATWELLTKVATELMERMPTETRPNLQRLFENRLEADTCAFSELYDTFNTPCMSIRNALREILDETQKQGQDFIYEHIWTPGQILLIDTEYVLQGDKNFSRVVHARMIPEGKASQGDRLWHSAI